LRGGIVDKREPIEVTMLSCDFVNDTITVSNDNLENKIGAGKYMLVPVEECVLSERESSDD
jgi:hypothetical protein